MQPPTSADLAEALRAGLEGDPSVSPAAHDADFLAAAGGEMRSGPVPFGPPRPDLSAWPVSDLELDAIRASGPDDPVLPAAAAPAYRRSRAKRVRLADPPMVGDRLVEVITIRPSTLGDLVMWQGGASAVDLLCALSGEPADVVMAIRFPDAERVLRAFHAQLPAAIRSAIAG